MNETTAISQSFGILYWLVMGATLIVIIKFGKGWWAAVLFAVALAVFSYLPVVGLIEQKKYDEYRAEGFERFNRYCKEKVGEKVYRRITNVESILMIRPRSSATDTQFTDQQWRGDPYGFALSDLAEIGSLLRPDRISANDPLLMGYEFVEVLITDAAGSKRIKQYRVTKRDRNDAAYNNLQETEVNEQKSKFGFTWEDISTSEDRRFWIAGGVLRVVDLTTNEIIAERVGYLIDPLFGNRSSGRIPWLSAVSNSCPVRVPGELRITRRFLTQVLQPITRTEN